MRIFKISLTLLLLSTSFIACKKDTEVIVPVEEATAPVTPETNQYVLSGVWVGEYITTTRTPPVYFSFDIHDDGVLNLLNESRGIVGSGTWSLTDSVFNAVYSIDSTQHSSVIRGVFNASLNQMNGDWPYVTQYQDIGYWYLNKAG